MMRSSNSKGKANSTEEAPLENGLSHTEEGDEAHKLAAKVVDNVVKLASEAADQRSRGNSPARTVQLTELKKLPTFQIDTVPSPPWSPSESVSSDPDPPVDAEQIDIQLQEDEQQVPDALTEEERESVRTFVEEILSEAMVVAEKKLKFVGLDDDDDEDEEDNAVVEETVQNQEGTEPVPSTSETTEEPEYEAKEYLSEKEAEMQAVEIRETAEKVVEEVLSKAQDTAADQLAKAGPSLDFPGLPTFQIDTVTSAPPSPESEEEPPQKQTKWSFKMQEDSVDAKSGENVAKEASIALITFENAPDDVKDVASTFIKEIVGKAITMAEEKAVPTVPFNFEDVDLIKTSGPWYVRVREGFMRVLRSACFCTPRRNDS